MPPNESASTALHYIYAFEDGRFELVGSILSSRVGDVDVYAGGLALGGAFHNASITAQPDTQSTGAVLLKWPGLQD